MRSQHFICKVEDSINDYKVVASIYYDGTEEEARSYFVKHKDISKHIGNTRYQISYRANATILQYPE
jgi:hypothetical protein